MDWYTFSSIAAVGNVHCCIELLTIFAKGVAMTGAANLITLAVNFSYPVAFLVFRFCMIFSISEGDTLH